MSEQAMAAPVCEHYWAWVSPVGARKSARICMLCHSPSADWLNHIVEVDRGHDNCVNCEFADPPAAQSESAPTPESKDAADE